MKGKNWISMISEHEVQYSSQGMQDGVIDFICEHIEIKNKYCIEFGYDSTSWDYCLPNTKYLVHERKWDHLLLDGNCHSPAINLYKHFITSDNICEIFEQYDVPNEPGYISIDLDSTDIWVTDALLEKYRPSFFSVEFNPNFPIDAMMAFPNDVNETWRMDRVMGSSLKALNLMAQNHGYALVYAGCYTTARHHDAFFIREDLIDSSDLPSLESFNNAHVPLHAVCINGRENIYLDYEVWLETKDLEKSRSAVPKEWKKHITGNVFQRLRRKQKILMHKLGFAE